MNPYEVLEIPPGAPPEEIKAAYHRMAKQWHPDRFTGEAKAQAETRFRMLAEAFNMLKDSVRHAPPPPASPQAAPEPQAPAIALDTPDAGAPGQVKGPDDWYGEATAAYEGKAYGRALALILYAIRLDDQRGEFHAFHAKVLDATGNDVRGKVRALELAIKLNPKDVDSLILLAKTFQSLGMQARATRLWENVHNIAPNHPVFQKQKQAGREAAPKAKEDLTLGEQWQALVAEARIALNKLFKRG